MKKDKAMYESPVTKVTPVNLESGICVSSADVENPNSDNGRIKGHDKNTDFGSGDWVSQGWD